MPMLRLIRGIKTEPIPVRDDGVSIRTLREQEQYVKSHEYQQLIAYIEYLEDRRKTRRDRKIKYCRIYNRGRYQLEKKLWELRQKKVGESYFPIKGARIPKITLDGTIIRPDP